MSQFGKTTGLAGKLRSFTVALLFMALAVAAEPAQSAPLDLTLQTSPDMMSDFIDVRYDAASQTLTARGFAQEIRDGAVEPTTVVNGAFEITATIANSGEVKSGTLTITGQVPSLGIAQSTLLTGNIAALGSGEACGPMEFKFNTSEGTMAFNFGPLVNVIVSQSGFGGNFAHDFSSNSIAVAGTGW